MQTLQGCHQNEQVKAENSKLRKTLNKAYDFMKQFVVDGRNLLERFLESIGQMVEKVRGVLEGNGCGAVFELPPCLKNMKYQDFLMEIQIKI